MSFVMQAVARVRRDGLKKLMPYALGRFHTVLTLYSAQSRALRGTKKQDVANTVFQGVDVEKAVANVKESAVHLPPPLPPEIVAELRKIAETADLEAISKGGKQFFHYADVKDAHLPNGELVLMGLVADAKQFPIANRIAEDPVALSVMAGIWDIRRRDGRSIFSGASLRMQRWRRGRSRRRRRSFTSMCTRTTLRMRHTTFSTRIGIMERT
jgi:hypothetical protein